MTDKLETLCEQACRVVVETGAFIRGERGKVNARQIQTKGLNSLVSYVDTEAERRLVEGLGELLPEATFLTEEATVEQQRSELRWIIDPLDGTTNFLHGLPCFAVSVGLEVSGELRLGIVYEVNRDECFFAWKGGGAFLNGDPIRVSDTPRLQDAVLATGFPYHDFKRVDPYFRALQELVRTTRGIRRFGAAAVDLAYVACGRFDGFFEYSLNPWDVAGGALLVQEAGGRVFDFNGGNDFLHGQEILAANPHLAPPLLQVLRESFQPA